MVQGGQVKAARFMTIAPDALPPVDDAYDGPLDRLPRRRSEDREAGAMRRTGPRAGASAGARGRGAGVRAGRAADVPADLRADPVRLPLLVADHRRRPPPGRRRASMVVGQGLGDLRACPGVEARTHAAVGDRRRSRRPTATTDAAGSTARPAGAASATYVEVTVVVPVARPRDLPFLPCRTTAG